MILAPLARSAVVAAALLPVAPPHFGRDVLPRLRIYIAGKFVWLMTSRAGVARVAACVFF